MTPTSPKQFYRWHNQYAEKGYKKVIIVGVIFTLFAHLLVFFILKNTNLMQSAFTEEELVTEEMFIEQVIIEQDEIKPETLPEVQPESISEHVEEIEDLLPELVDQDIDLSTEIEEPEVALTVNVPTKLGETEGIFEDVLPTEAIFSSMDELGKGADILNDAAEGQVVIEEGSVQGDWLESELEIDDALLKGAEGNVVEGALTGYSSLDDLLNMSAVNIQGARTALPSDLMFEYNSAELRESARFGLMKLAMVIDQNEQMYCILEGHTDLSGSAQYNQTLSVARAQAVKDWLVNSMRLSDEKLVVRGYGKQFPIVLQGSIDAQRINRRVDILLRKEIPARRTSEQSTLQPSAEKVIPQQPKVKVEVEPTLQPEIEDPTEVIPEEVVTPPKAQLVEEEEQPVKAIPVNPPTDPIIRRAIPVLE